jgi:hypothetical protein
VDLDSVTHSGRLGPLIGEEIHTGLYVGPVAHDASGL